MKRILGIVLVLCGAAAIFAAVLRSGGMKHREEQAQADFNETLQILQQVIPDEGIGMPLELSSGQSDMSGASVFLAGDHSCIGILSFPAHDVSFPVGSVSEEDYSIIPCLQSSDSFVIEGIPYEWQFGILNSVGMGEQVVFTDVCGHQYVYQTTNVQRLKNGADCTEDLQLFYAESKTSRFYIGCDFVSRN